jgi:hypothetical protein
METTFFFLLHSEWGLRFFFVENVLKSDKRSLKLCHSDNVAVDMTEVTRYRSGEGSLKASAKETKSTQKVQHCIIVHCQDVIAARSTCTAPVLPLQSEGMPQAISMLLGRQCSLILMPL